MILKYIWGTPLYAESIKLRSDILRKPLGLEFSIEELVAESNYLHFGLINDCNDLLACLYLKPDEDGDLQLKQMAVKNEFQDMGLGRKLINGVEEIMKLSEFNEIYLHARESAKGFYMKLGYEIKGDLFTEMGLSHVKMMKKIN